MRHFSLALAALTIGCIGLAGSSMSWADDAREVKAGDVVLHPPASWKQQQPSNNLRLAQFVIPAAEGSQPAELVLSGPFAGSVNDNVKRWIDQFQAGDRKYTITEGAAAQGKYIFVVLEGTYLKPIGPPIQGRSEAAPNSKMAAVMLMLPQKGNYFLKLAGPADTVGAALDDLRKSFGGSADSEKEFSLEAR